MSDILTFFSLAFPDRLCYNENIFRRRDVPNGEIPKANLLFLITIKQTKKQDLDSAIQQ